MLKAGLVESPRRGYVKISQKGLVEVNKKPQGIDIKYLEQFPEFNEFRSIKKDQSSTKSKTFEETEKGIENITPDELMETGFNSIQASLGQEVLDKIRKNTPSFFEKIVLKLLSSMDYGEGKVTGRSGDGGIDGFIYQDKLGLDKILFQAKRYGENNVITPSMLRDFIGALTTDTASKGVFITTSRFPKDAENIISRSPKPIRLIDATNLVKLIISFNIGLSTEKTYDIKKIDSNFFTEE